MLQQEDLHNKTNNKKFLLTTLKQRDWLPFEQRIMDNFPLLMDPIHNRHCFRLLLAFWQGNVATCKVWLGL